MYNSLLSGWRVKATEHPVPYCRAMVESVFQDPLTLDVFKYPVIVEKTGNVYDLSNLAKWLATSDKEPLTGIELVGEDRKTANVRIIPAVSIILAMLAFEVREDDTDFVYYHAPVGILYDIQEIVRNIVVEKKAVEGFSEQTLSLDLRHYGLVGEFESISLKKLVGYCPITDRTMYGNIASTNLGKFVHTSTFIDSLNMYNTGSMAYLMSLSGTRNNKIILPETFINGLFELAELEPVPDNFMCVSKLLDECDKPQICYRDSLGKKGSYKPTYREKVYGVASDPYLSCKTTVEHMYNEGLETVAKGFDENIKKYLERASKTIIRTFGGGERGMIQLRYNVGFPSCLSKDTIYGDDWSYLELDKNIFDKTTCPGGMKMDCFLMTTMTNVVFRDIDIACASFIGTRGTVRFQNCTFKECVFHKVDDLSVTFIRCGADEKSRKYLILSGLIKN